MIFSRAFECHKCSYHVHACAGADHDHGGFRTSAPMGTCQSSRPWPVLDQVSWHQQHMHVRTIWCVFTIKMMPTYLQRGYSLQIGYNARSELTIVIAHVPYAWTQQSCPCKGNCPCNWRKTKQLYRSDQYLRYPDKWVRWSETNLDESALMNGNFNVSVILFNNTHRRLPSISGKGLY